MQNWLKLDGTMRAVALAIVAAIVTAVISMLVPVGIWETITGSTGISEIFPATAAPLGDTARALIAFLAGLAAFAVTAVMLMRRDTPATPKPASVTVVDAGAPVATDRPSLIASAKVRLTQFIESRRSGPVVTELSDLPKLRAGDAHPDAPPRRPISAQTDLADIASEPAPLPVVDIEPEPAVSQPAPVAEAALEAPQPVPVVEAEAAESETVSAMVERLEAAVALREQQLAKLEAIARSEAAKPEPVSEAPVIEIEVAPRASHLEAVPSEPARPARSDAMDDALRSALETLHRINARTR